MAGRFFHVPISVATTPANGEALVDRWWSIHPEKGLAFWYQPFGYARSEEPSPQCNPAQDTAEHLTRKLHPDHECRQIPVVFFQHAIRAMKVDLVKARADRDARSTRNESRNSSDGHAAVESDMGIPITEQNQ